MSILLNPPIFCVLFVRSAIKSGIWGRQIALLIVPLRRAGKPIAPKILFARNHFLHAGDIMADIAHVRRTLDARLLGNDPL